MDTKHLTNINAQTSLEQPTELISFGMDERPDISRDNAHLDRNRQLSGRRFRGIDRQPVEREYNHLRTSYGGRKIDQPNLRETIDKKRNELLNDFQIHEWRALQQAIPDERAGEEGTWDVFSVEGSDRLTSYPNLIIGEGSTTSTTGLLSIDILWKTLGRLLELREAPETSRHGWVQMNLIWSM